MTILTLSFTAPATASAATGYALELMALPEGEITINYSQGVLYINGGEGKMLENVHSSSVCLLLNDIYSFLMLPSILLKTGLPS